MTNDDGIGPKTHHLMCLGPFVCFFFCFIDDILLTTFLDTQQSQVTEKGPRNIVRHVMGRWYA
jgi:hypothetical protein